MKKMICTILFLALLLSGCNSTPVETESTSIETTVPVEEETLFVPDDLPETMDFQNETVGINIGNYADAYWSDLYSDGLNGNRMNDAIYTVISSVEERLQVDLAYSKEDFVYDGMGAYKTKILGNIMAGDDSMDMVISVICFAESMQEGEYFLNLADTPYINLEKPWYNHTIVENLPSDYIYFLSGSFALTNIKYAYGMYFNDTLKTAMNITEDLYAVVDEGKWTFDKLNSVITDTYVDLDGDTAASIEDQYGLSFGGVTYSLGFMSAFDVSVFEKENNSYIYTYGSERIISVVEKLCALVNENPSVYPAKWNNDPSQLAGIGGTFISKIFTEGRSIFTCDTLSNAPAILSDIDFEYGLLPYPKWDEKQTNYQNRLQRSGYALIPTTANHESASAVLEALSSASYRVLVPEYFEETLKARYAQDSDMSRMYDIINSSIVYDPGEIFSDLLGSPSAEFYMAIYKNQPNWASKAASMETKLQAAMDSMFE